MRRYLLLAVLLPVMAGTSLVPVAGAAADPAPSLSLLAVGQVLDATGRPAAGALELLAWPETHALEVGDRVDLVPVTSGTAGPDGTFSLHAAPSAQLLSLARRQGGYVNLELRSTTGQGMTVTHFSRFVDGPVRAVAAGGGSGVWQARPGEPASPVEVRVPAGSHRPPAGKVVPLASMRCGPYELKDKQRASTLVGELRTDGDTEEAFFVYGERADSDISVGMRFGGGGAWSLSGDHHVSNRHSSAVTQWVEPFSSQDLAVRTDFDYGRFEQDCYDVHTEQIRSLGWNGGGLGTHVVSDRGCSEVPTDFVQRYNANGGFERKDERAATYGGAAEAFGFSFAARSGHSKHVQMVWKFGRAPAHLICGDDDRPYKSSRVFAGESPRMPQCRPGKPC